MAEWCGNGSEAPPGRIEGGDRTLPLLLVFLGKADDGLHHPSGKGDWGIHHPKKDEDEGKDEEMKEKMKKRRRKDEEE